ncbi:sigma factor-like helix-turn-helix DNA-binding protein [Shouchella sp. 1P09AA]|uniref:sigma factor-like helix-turn-helix DNA-binding protein n=1 Tax=unclassified Shouchella TaxID=2893065 RepID=UPI0039A16AC3
MSNRSRETEKIRFEERYGTLSTARQIQFLLKDVHVLQSRVLNDDFTACDIFIDLNEAIEKASLTKRQRDALYYVYICDYTQVEAAEKMGVAQQNIRELIKRSTERIAEIFYYWTQHDLGYRGGY